MKLTQEVLFKIAEEAIKLWDIDCKKLSFYFQSENTVYKVEDSDNNFFTSITEVVEDGEKYIIDASVYTLNLVPNESLVLNYAYGLKDSMNFVTDAGVTLENFIAENNNSIISDAYTNLILYFDNTKINHYLLKQYLMGSI